MSAAAVPRGPALLVALSLVVLFAAAFVSVPAPVGAVAMAGAAAGAAWLALALRRWQMGLAAAWMAWHLAEPLVTRRPPPPGGTGTLVTLVAFAVLVLGGWWVGRRSAGD